MKIVPTACAVLLSLIAAAATASFSTAAEPVRIGDLSIEQAWARATIPSARTAAVYLTVRNAGDRPDRIVSLETAVAGHAMPHETKQDGDVARMVESDGPGIPAAGVLDMKPGGTHVMLMDLKGGLKPGQSFVLTVTFERAGPVTVPVTVGRAGAMGPE